MNFSYLTCMTGQTHLVVTFPPFLAIPDLSSAQGYGGLMGPNSLIAQIHGSEAFVASAAGAGAACSRCRFCPVYTKTFFFLFFFTPHSSSSKAEIELPLLFKLFSICLSFNCL